MRMNRIIGGVKYITFLSLLAASSIAAPGPGARTSSLEEASLQLGALQAQAQYPPAAVQGARAASSSAASCLVTAVQYTHGQQIWRPDPCEFCLCLDGEMFCWWQDCPPAAPGPCPGPQPFSICGNSSESPDKKPPSVSRKSKKPQKKVTGTSKKIKTIAKMNSKPLITTVHNTSPTVQGVLQSHNEFSNQTNVTKTENKNVLNQTRFWQIIESEDDISNSDSEKMDHDTSNDALNVNKTNNSGVLKVYDNVQTTASIQNSMSVTNKDWMLTSSNDYENKKQSVTSTSSEIRTGCLVMGVEYQVGQMLPSTGSCLSCRCSRGNIPGSPPRVSCAPRGCAPPDPVPQDDTGAL